jgi:hypothetical protein
MGIARGAIALLAQEAARRPFTGKLATLGRQRIHASSEEVTRQMQRFGIVPRRPLTDPVDDVSLFEALGFDTVHSYDYSDYEAATYLLDLNSGVVPDGAAGAYDVVFDSGTIEHVFHVPNSLKTIVEMTKVGGRIILLSPSSNHLDHGFYMFSPTLFCDYFAANKLEVETSYLVRYSPDPSAAWNVYRYHPREWDTLQIGGLDGSPYLNFIVAKKTAQSTSVVIPQQNFYASTSAQYGGSRLADDAAAQAADVAGADSSAGAGMRRAARDALGRVPGALPLAQKIVRQARKALLNKPLVGRY